MMLSPDNLTALIVAAIAGLGAGLGPTLAVVINIFLLKRSDARLRELQQSAAANLQLTEETHAIVNGPTAERKRLVAKLSRRIANENPRDQDAQLAARFAERDAESDKA